MTTQTFDTPAADVATTAGRDAGRSLAAGGLTFAATALIYATVELWFTKFVGWLFFPEAFTPVYRPYALAAFATYAVVGFVLGVLFAAVSLALRIGDSPNRETATLVLLIAVLASFSVHHQRGLLPTELVCLALVALCIAAVVSPSVRNRVRPLTSPWTASLLAIAPDWLKNDALTHGHSGRFLRASSFVLAVVAIVVAAFIVQRVFGRLTPTMRRAITACLLILTPLTALALPQANPEQLPLVRRMRVPADSPNVLLITLDTVRADHLSLYGYARDTTPVLREFARGATVYKTVTAPSNYTLATHASLFTGLYGSEHGAHLDDGWPEGRPLQPRIPTLAEIFRTAGYDVSGVVANHYFLNREFGLSRGFGYYFSRFPPGPTAAFTMGARKHLLAYGVWSLLCRRLSLWSDFAQYYRAEEISARVAERVEHAATAKRPFFIFANYFDAHDPYTPPPEFQARFPGRIASASPFLVREKLVALQRGGRLSLTDAEKAHLTSQYDGAIAYVDRSVGSVIDNLRRSGAYDNTLIVITSDHGEALGEHNALSHGTSMFDEQVRVPLIVKLPQQTEGSVVEGTTALTDVFLLVASRGQHAVTPHADVVTESFPIVSSSPPQSRMQRGRAIIRGSYKLVQPGDAWPAALFNLSKDPGETNDIAAVEPVRVAELSAALRAWTQAHFPRRNDGDLKRVDDETRSALRSIGYIQ